MAAMVRPQKLPLAKITCASPDAQLATAPARPGVAAVAGGQVDVRPGTTTNREGLAPHTDRVGQGQAAKGGRKGQQM